MNVRVHSHKDTHACTRFRTPESWLRLAENRQSNNRAKIEAKSSNRDKKTPGILNS